MGIGQRGPTGSLANERGRAKTASWAPACFLSGLSGWFSFSLGAWVPKIWRGVVVVYWFRRRITLILTLTRARALMARPWSARCYGVAWQREGSRQNSIGGSGVLSLRPFGLVLFFPWRVGAEDLARRSCGLLVSAAHNLNSHPYARAREGADGQAVVCPLLRGSLATRGVAPKQHRGLRRAFSPAFRAGSLFPLARGCRRSGAA